MKPRWQSASRPPNSCRDVLVYLAEDSAHDASMSVGWYYQDRAEWLVAGSYNKRVTHWQNLPAPPRKKGART